MQFVQQMANKTSDNFDKVRTACFGFKSIRSRKGVLEHLAFHKESILSPLIFNTRETNAATVACTKQLASLEMEKL